jgi:ParB/RepB/Spo0J family partition protein
VRKDKLRWVNVSDLIQLRRNPQYLTPKQMEALVQSIRRDGFLVPILVTPREDGKYDIISGNHRALAAEYAGLSKIPALIAELDARTAQRVAINLNTVHGELSAETLAPFLADMDEELLRTVYLDEASVQDLVQFDEALARQLAALDVPESLNQDSPKSSLPTCTCPVCGKKHAPSRM